VIGVACPNDPRHQLSPIGSTGGAPERQRFGETSGGDRIAVAFTCSACSEVQGAPVYFGKSAAEALVDVRVPPEPAVGNRKIKGIRRLPRTVAVGVLGLAIVCYVATVYLWFDSSIWGGVAFFALFAALAIAYRADDNAARRRGTPERPAM
jgi:hypothetical protein